MQTGEPLTLEELQLGGTELKRLHTRREALHIRPDGILEIHLVVKPGRNKSLGSRQRLYTSLPWQKVSINLVRPMPQTQRDNQQIFVLSDHFTDWEDAIPSFDATTPTVATAMDKLIFCYFGLPEQLLSDLGRQFQT